MTEVVDFSRNPSATIAGEFRFGLRSLPFLADHGFQGMVVLPGAAFVELATRIHRELFQGPAGVIQNLRFETPLVLSDDDVVVRVDATEKNDFVLYRFYEDEGVRKNSGFPPRPCATLEITHGLPNCCEKQISTFCPNTFQVQADAVIQSRKLYERFSDNNNQYGPTFQRLGNVWQTKDTALSIISTPTNAVLQRYEFAIVLDAMTQLLATFMIEQHCTFILRSVESIAILDPELPKSLWCQAMLSSETSETKGATGDVRLFDDSGKLYVHLSGVAFDLLDQPASLNKNRSELVIASNFTAEPVEESLNFWSDYLEMPLKLQFTPYNQIFQQLLDPNSGFGKNKTGIDVILLALEEWDVTGGVSPFSTTVAKSFGDLETRTLPNGLEVSELNSYETNYVYKEIFEDQSYLRHGIHLQDNATVIDIGANIGLFSLFVMSRCKTPTIYSYEPAPAAYARLAANCSANGRKAHAFNLGVSDKPGTATLTFYENSSVFSSFHSDEIEDRGAIQAVVRNVLASVVDQSLEEYVNELSTHRLHGTTHECRLTTVSDIIRDNNIATINLLKIDAEKSEVDIINGIADQDWAKIDQIVIEIHDRSRKKQRQIEEVLVSHGYSCAIEEESLLEHSGLFNLYATRGTGSQNVSCDEKPTIATTAPPTIAPLDHNIHELCTALQTFREHSTVPVVLHICPRSPAANSDYVRRKALEQAEYKLIATASSIAGVTVINSDAMHKLYPVSEYYDAESYRAGHVPYTTEGFVAIGTALSRTLFSLRRSPLKVIVLDCDNTLWGGVCGEDGVDGVEITNPYQILQQFMLTQMSSGMLLCLCSKNNEKDVLDVLDLRSDMLLRRDHLVAWRLNWDNKSENIRSLARELNLDLSSFIFLDDNPIECADVRSNCPEVLTLQLPHDAKSIPSFLKHVWPFDHLGGTHQDQSRTRAYQENIERRHFRESTLSLKDFISGLQLRIEIRKAAKEELRRVSQLTFRTNQFNLTSIRRSESELLGFLKDDANRCLVISVADRFGDYGLVGVILYNVQESLYRVDILLLSCRVLGRGVEHAALRYLGQCALLDGRTHVQLTYEQTQKNLPAWDFLQSLDPNYRDEKVGSFTFVADRLTELEYNVSENALRNPQSGIPAISPRSQSILAVANNSLRIQRIGDELREIRQIAKAAQKNRIGTQTDSISVLSLDDPIKISLMAIWRKVLGRSRIGLDENFFDAGGTSLKAVQMVAMIKRDLHQSISIASVFEFPTLSLLADRLRPAVPPSVPPSHAHSAILRGQQRRYKTARNSG